ncbi:MAG: histidine--tRNA ligase, partial [Spirochaetaceae bacterium]|nr:histidine--tRNA ligase [Spirochaetaceae bacterium]
RRKLIRALEDHFTSFGYVPIDTPVLEYAEILLSKGGGDTDKQTYRFNDHGGRDVALRFDLTVPFARYIAAHRNELTMPFKRFHIGKVWRGENTQRGRYREFMQCDFDVIGTDSPAADLEIMLMMAAGLRAIGAGESRIRFSHRGLFNQLLSKLGLEGKTAEVLRIVDKIGKIGADEVRALLGEMVDKEGTETLLDFISPAENNRKTLEKMAALAGMDDTPGPAEVRIKAILDAVEELQLQHGLVLDPSITRGLDYYTGIVFETFLDDLPGLGSVCSGGRYGNLTGLFMKEPVSGVGASIGLDRLMAGLEELGRIDNTASSTDILILMLDESLLAKYQMFAHGLRQDGLAAEVYPEIKKFGAQFKYAEAKEIPLALIVGAEENEAGTVNLKDLRTRESYNGLSFADARVKALELLGN